MFSDFLNELFNLDTSELVIICLLTGLFILLAVFVRFAGNVRRKEYKEKETASRRRITKKTREAVLERDGYTCQICGISRQYMDDLCPGLGDYLLLEIDHITSVSNGGTGKDEANLQTLCWRCNRKKSGHRTNEEVREIIDYGMDRLE